MAEERDPPERARDSRVSKRYREELGAEEPPRALDQAILAASRRAVESRPAPLLGPGGRRRWYFPVAAAAVITLAVAVTVQVERQKPDEPVIASAPVQERKEQQAFKAPAPVDEAKPAQAPARAPKAFTPEPPPAAAPAPQSAEAMRDLAKSNEAVAAQGSRAAEAPAQADERARGQAQPRSDVAETRRMERELQIKPAAPVASAPKPAAAPPVAAQSAPARDEMRSSRSHPDVAAEATLGGAREPLYRTGMPETWIEHIAQLRKQGKHDEAEKELAEFRKRHPDFRMTDETRAKVEKKN